MPNYHTVFSALLKTAGLLLVLVGCSSISTPEPAITRVPSLQAIITPNSAEPTVTPVQATAIPPTLPLISIESKQDAVTFNSTEIVSDRIVLFADPTLPDKPEAYLDLDTGEQSIAEGDIRFVVSGGSMLFYTLEPVNGGKADFVGVEELGVEGCQQMADLLSEGNIPEIAAGHYICAITNQGRLAQLRIDEVNPQGKNTLQISFTTWEIKID